MAKFNIELEIDWFHPDEGIDEILKSEIIKKATSLVTEKVNSQIEKEVSEFVEKEVKHIANKRLLEYMDNFLEQDFKKVDKWGEITKITNPKKELKNMLDNFLKDKVNSKGELTTKSWGSNEGITRQDHILNEVAQKHINQYKAAVSEQVLAGIKEDINKETQQRVVDSILRDYDLKKLIGKS